MNNYVIDSSVAMAFIHKESGYADAAQYIEHGIVSAVNFSEILYATVRKNINFDIVKTQLLKLLPFVVSFDTEQAEFAAKIEPLTRQYGLSLADRACLALGKSMGFPVITADKAWKELDIGVEIILIR